MNIAFHTLGCKLNFSETSFIANNGNFGVDTANGVVTNVGYSEADVMMLDVSIEAVDDGTDELLIIELSD